VPLPYRIAHRIAVNRTIAGVHYPVDSAAGAMLGRAIGEAILALAITKRPRKVFDFGSSLKLVGSEPHQTEDFTLAWFKNAPLLDDAGSTATLRLMKAAFQQAANEWGH